MKFDLVFAFIQISDLAFLHFMGNENKASCAEDRGDSISNLGHGESTGDLPPSSPPTGNSSTDLLATVGGLEPAQVQ
jgi:hypothetical protein